MDKKQREKKIVKDRGWGKTGWVLLHQTTVPEIFYLSTWTMSKFNAGQKMSNCRVKTECNVWLLVNINAEWIANTNINWTFQKWPSAKQKYTVKFRMLSS